MNSHEYDIGDTVLIDINEKVFMENLKSFHRTINDCETFKRGFIKTNEKKYLIGSEGFVYDDNDFYYGIVSERKWFFHKKNPLILRTLFGAYIKTKDNRIFITYENVSKYRILGRCRCLLIEKHINLSNNA